MRKILSTVALLICATVAHAQSDKLKIEKLNDYMYVYTTYQEFKGITYPSNALYVLTDEGAILIDTPWDKEQYEPLVNHIKEEHHKDVKWVITTHFHEDRSGGLDYFNKLGAQTYTYSLTNDILKDRNEPQALHTFGQEKQFTFGKEKLAVYFLGEGHSKDNTVVWFPKEKILYGGCLIKSAEATTIGNIEDGNVADWPKTIEVVKRKFSEAKQVIPGHDAWDMSGHIENTERILSAYAQQNSIKNK
ncbi:MUS/TUS/MOC family subclass B1 metallo-beta-lactamase [Myroides marinus]|uniref:MUS/TUS/MOC family subclass B1 metallo-beta-lactamase n=1 Tax=Myroides TaxID=76831 RepID=UPI0025788D9A|nr:MUS/TUS/MOC family subclass B1 metallo-beta-lactamase [Myroides marinus]MDM1359918.1 MUS/TUS/MOC family subclass B1 metallo-beta-lactamase [Myroides marinus]